MKEFVTQDQIIRQVKEKTGYSLKDLKEAFDALEEVLLENMLSATDESPSEIRLFHGWKIGAKVLPEREAVDPRNGEKIITPRKFSPYCSFEQYYRQKINKIENTQE